MKKIIEWLLLSIIVIVVGVVQFFSGAAGWIFGFILIVALIFGLYIMLRSFYRQIKKETNIPVRFIVGWVLTIIGFFGFISGMYHDYGYGPQGALYLLTLIVLALFGLYMIFDSITDEFKKIIEMKKKLKNDWKIVLKN